MRAPTLWGLLVLVSVTIATAEDPGSLPDVGAAQDVAPISSSGAEIGLSRLCRAGAGVAFVYAWCPDICPLLMARVQRSLGASFGICSVMAEE